MTTEVNEVTEVNEEDFPKSLSVMFQIDRHLDASSRYPGRNVIIKDIADLGFMPFQKMLDPQTGEPLCTSAGHQKYTLQTQHKVEIISMIDGIEDTSSDALTEAYLVFGALGVPGKEEGCLMLIVNEMIKAFDESQEILIPTAEKRKFILHFDYKRHAHASRRYLGRNFILKDLEQLESVHFHMVFVEKGGSGDHLGELERDNGEQKNESIERGHTEFHSSKKIDIIPMIDGVEDTSPNALREAFIVFRGNFSLDATEGIFIPILEVLVKAFDENQEILIDCQGLEAICKVFPRRNVIIKDMSQVELGALSLSLDPDTGAQLFNSEGFKKVTLQTTNKVDILSTIDGVEDTSPDALKIAFLLFRGALIPDEDNGNESVMIEELVKAFDEDREIIVDI